MKSGNMRSVLKKRSVVADDSVLPVWMPLALAMGILERVCHKAGGVTVGVPVRPLVIMYALTRRG